MIRGNHCVMRTAEADDAYSVIRLYDRRRPRASLLDRRREMILPGLHELREFLTRKDKVTLSYLTIEDTTGVIRGLCTLRGGSREFGYGEFVLLLLDDADYESALAREAFAFLCRSSFHEKKLDRVVAHCLPTEKAYRKFLIEAGFESNGVQREIFFNQGQWMDLETLTLCAEAVRLEGVWPPAAQESEHAVNE